MATCKFIREADDILWVGPPGVGKSHLCQALGYQAVKMGFTVLYRSIFDLVREFMQDEAFAGEDKILKKYLKPELLIIDDMGMKQLPRRSGEFLFEVIMRRHETRSTVMTSNRPLEDWGKLIGDVPAADGNPLPLPGPRGDHHDQGPQLPAEGPSRKRKRRCSERARGESLLPQEAKMTYMETYVPGRF